MSQDIVLVGVCLVFALILFALAMDYRVRGRFNDGKKKAEVDFEKPSLTQEGAPKSETSRRPASRPRPRRRAQG